MSEETKQKPNNNQEEQKNDTQSNTGKSKDAKALGIPIITEEELNALG